MAEPVYEMLWDCRSCGSPKLLGLTHRHCPNCGSKQDPNARYFPAESDKVAVQNHQYVGADLQCRYCSAACSQRAHNCGNCGALLAEGAPVPQQAEAPPQAMSFAGKPLSTPPQRALWKIAVPVAVLACVAVVVTLLIWKKEQRLVVAAHTWRRSIAIERYGPHRQSSWCDAMPSGAQDISRHREQKGTRRVPDGEDCHTRKKDQGDGTFVETQDCTNRYKEEPVYADKCDYALVKWAPLREAVAEGQSLSDPPRWPDVELIRSGCAFLGCERAGGRYQKYTVVFRDSAGETYRCDVPEPRWSRFTDGKSYPAKLRALVGTLDCASVSP